MSTTHIPVSGNQSAAISGTMERPQWLDEQLYPFQSRFVEIDGNRIHYIDEGTGPILLFLHGNPAWSFLYRNIVKGLRDRFRCIALDSPGFGLSTAAPGYRYTLTSHSRLVERFIEALGLSAVTLVGHDASGAVGLGVVGRHPEWFRALVISNSFAWSLNDYPSVERFIKVASSRFFGFLIVNFDFLTRYFVKSVDGGKLSEAEKRAYRGPTADRSVRRYQHQVFQSIIRSHDYLVDLEQRLLPLKDMPVLIVFGDGDATMKAGFMSRFEQMFPRHRSVLIQGSDHFPQEHAPGEIATAIRDWWDEEIEPGATKEKHSGVI